MDFDLSKENIQPLRGGRNVSQLEVALQAQSDSELQRELVQQKDFYEEAIRTYEGDDPLDNWYNYISWLEQSYPKHGHEGNLTPVLEECLAKFENDERYVHDRRFCKLWIKYVDSQRDPLELFQLLHSKGICVSCADLYRAWACYHEIAGDYKRADVVFQLGLRAFAQPYEELVFAHENMFAAIGRQTLQGVDERRLVEQRHALTSLRTYKHKHRTVVPSVRTGHQVLHTTPGVLQSISSRQGRSSNVQVTMYEEQGAVGASVNISILEVARNQEKAKKENTLKPGPWATNKTGSLVTQHRSPSFKVHEDDEPQLPEGLCLPKNHEPKNYDDFRNWIVDLYFPDPVDSSKIPMYPKHLVYCGEATEYSPEEIRARKWFAQRYPIPTDASINMQETMSEEGNIVTTSNANIARHSLAQPLALNTEFIPRQSVLSQDISAYNPQALMQTSYYPRQSNAFPSSSAQSESQHEIVNRNYSTEHFPSTSNPSDSYLRKSLHTSQIYRESQNNFNAGAEGFMSSSGMRRSYIQMDGNVVPDPFSAVPVSDRMLQPGSWTNEHIYHDSCSVPATHVSSQSESYHSSSSKSHSEATGVTQQWPGRSLEKKMLASPPHTVTNSTMTADNNCTLHTREVMKDVNELWKDNLTTLQESTVEIPKQAMPQFQIHEDTDIREDVDRNHQDGPFRKSIARTQNSDTQLHKIVPPSQFNIYQDDSATKKSLQYPQSIISSEKLRTPFSSQLVLEKVSEYPQKKLYSKDDDNFVHPSEIRKPGYVILEDNATVTPAFNETCSTQTFNFNINTMQASTPFNYKKQAVQQFANATIFETEQIETLKPHTKKILFDENTPDENKTLEQWHALPVEHEVPQEKLSVILETSKEYRSSSSSSSGGTTLKTTTFNLKTIPEVSGSEINSIMMSEMQSNPIETHCTTSKDNDFIRFSTAPNQIDVEHDNYYEISGNSGMNNVETHCTISKDNNLNRFSTVPNDINNENEDYNGIINLLRSESPVEDSVVGVVTNSQITCKKDVNIQLPKTSNVFLSQPNNIIDLTGDESIKIRYSNFPIQFSQENKINNQKNISQTFESPVKNQYKDNIEISNDSMSSSPVKGFRMDVDTNYLSQNSNSQFKMDCDSYQELPGSIGGPILQRAPSDPFSTEVQNALLDKIGFPGIKHLKTVIKVQTFPKLAGKKEVVQIGDRRYMVEKVLGKGAFGCVYKALDLNTDERVALKYQKPPNKWEYYICKEIQARVANLHMLNAFMDVTFCYYNNNGSILVSDLCKYGSLLDVANKVKQVTGKGVKEMVAIYYATEIFTIVNILHKCQIIHADIKPDNFLVTRMPPEYGHPSLKLIDFGCSIDMSLFPKGTTFTKVVATEDFICTEMKDGRPWTYQTDIFCIAATIHVLLFEKYMQLQKRGDVWSISQRIPRYMRTDFWNTFFYELLNIESCDKLPDLSMFKGSLESIVSSQAEELQIDLRFVANTVIGK